MLFELNERSLYCSRKQMRGRGLSSLSVCPVLGNYIAGRPFVADAAGLRPLRRSVFESSVSPGGGDERLAAPWVLAGSYFFVNFSQSRVVPGSRSVCMACIHVGYSTGRALTAFSRSSSSSVSVTSTERKLSSS